ncbi:uncharacterized protein METZ01_LOCUS507443, partial [marine metagenome]
VDEKKDQCDDVEDQTENSDSPLVPV